MPATDAFHTLKCNLISLQKNLSETPFLEYKLAACSGVQISTTRLLQDRLSDYSCDLQVHSASTVAGMAFANAFLGICHSIAHKVKSKRKHFKIPNDLGHDC